MSVAPIRIGVVDAHEPGLAAVRVRFPDLRGGGGRPIVSEPLPVLQPFAGASGPRAYRLPAVGQQVAVAFTDAGGAVGPSAGVVLGALYADANELPSDDPGADVVVFPDGTRVEYHPERGVTIDAAGSVSVKAGGSAKVESAGAVTVKGATLMLDGGGPVGQGLLVAPFVIDPFTQTPLLVGKSNTVNATG